MDFTLTVVDENKITCKNDIADEEHSLLKKPSTDSLLVLAQRKEILQTIQLDELFKNLDNCVELLDITYNAVNGIGLSSTVTQLKDQFSRTMDTSLVVMSGFKSGTDISIGDFIEAYTYLINPMYVKTKINGVALAIKTLLKIQVRATSMVEQANTLANSFDSIEKVAMDITRRIMDERDLDVRKKEEAQKKLKEIQDKVEVLKTVKDDLQDQISDYGKQYSELSNQIKDKEAGARNIAIISAVFGGIASLFGKSPKANAESEPTVSSGGPSKKQTFLNLEGVQKEIDEYQKRLEELTSRIKTIAGELKKEDITEDQKNILRKENDELSSEKAEIDSELNSAKTKKSAYCKVLGIADSMIYTSEQLAKLAKEQESHATTSYGLLDNIFKQKAEAQKEQREVLKELATMTSEIANTSATTRDLDIVINSLITAVSSMKIVKVYLADIAIFWKNVAKFCEGLVEKVKDLNDNIKDFGDEENYIEIFKDSNFIEAYLMNMVNWAALYKVSSEYLDAFYMTREKYKEYELVPETDSKSHWERARNSAVRLNEKLVEVIKS